MMSYRVQSLAVGTFLLLLLALAGCTPRETTPPRSFPEEPDISDGDRDESSFGRPIPQQLLDELVRETESVRELTLNEPIEAISVTPDQIREHIERELADLEMVQAEQIMLAFGFIPEGTDLRAVMVELLGAEVIGLYDPDRDRLMVLQSIASSLSSGSMAAMEARSVLIHELTHALQDQHFDTLEHSSDEAWTDDAGTVWSCLAEGDATLSMMVASVRMAGMPVDITTQPGFRQQSRALSEASLPTSPALSGAPPYFGFVMAATYFEGMAFAADLRRLGGWSAVDDAHRNPPRCTRDILHPSRYLTGYRLYEIALPSSFSGLESPAYSHVHSATLGELETSAYLLPLEDPDRQREAAAGWAGDRFAVYEAEGGEAALVWRLRFETEGDASQFFQAALEVESAQGRGPCQGQIQRDDNVASPRFAICAEGRDRIDERGLDVAVVRNVPTESAEGLIEALFGAPASEQTASPPQPNLSSRISELEIPQ